MDEDNKNDYKLINLLLEDGSESSILKLKMIVDLDDNDLIMKIRFDKRMKFVLIFKEHFSKTFVDNPQYVHFVEDDKIYLVREFKQSFEQHFLKHPHAIWYFPHKNVMELLNTFKDSFYNGFKNNTFELSYINHKKELTNLIKQMFPDIKLPT